MASLSSEVLRALYSHLTLPPRLPEQDDAAPGQVLEGLFEIVHDAARYMKGIPPNRDSKIWKHALRAVARSKSIHVDGHLSQTVMREHFQKLQVDDFLILYVDAQNSGIIVQRNATEYIQFEVYEASPDGEKVLEAHGPLHWQFPGMAVIVPYSTFTDTDFQLTTCEFLEQASHVVLQHHGSTVTKAGTKIYENRQSVKPHLISEVFMTVLQAWGSISSPQYLCKRIRDDVHWSEGSARPWRRSPSWLVVRVALQRFFTFADEDGDGQSHYKLLVCLVLAIYGEHVLQQRVLQPEELVHVRNKLARRLFKLERHVQDQHTASTAFCSVFAALESRFEKLLQNINQHVETLWQAHKTKTLRPIYSLRRFPPHDQTLMSLHNSGTDLENTLRRFRQNCSLEVDSCSVERIPAQGSSTSTDEVFRQHLLLSEREAKIENDLLSNDSVISQERCVQLANLLEEYVTEAQPVYAKSPERLSYMLLTVMDIWMAMDKCACATIHLLSQYPPEFSPKIMHDIWVSRRHDLERLNRIEAYIEKRCKTAQKDAPSIFSKPTPECFATRYFHQSPDSAMLRSLYAKIEAHSAAEFDAKQKEWVRLHREYDSNIEKADSQSCILLIENPDDERYGQHDKKRCRRCYLLRVAKRMRIQVHEDYLPNNRTEACCVVFELRAPMAYQKYRDATWKILSQLALTVKVTRARAPTALRDFQPLSNFASIEATRVALASEKKPFTVAHYKQSSFPVSSDKVCVPHGMTYLYWDKYDEAETRDETKTRTLKGGLFPEEWLGGGPMRPRPSFAKLCGAMPLLEGTALAKSGYWDRPPTANEIIASQTKCPQEINMNEYLALQDLQSGVETSMMRLLRELGEPNINWRSSQTVGILLRLVMQAGPRAVNSETANNFLRARLWVLGDGSFCQRLLSLLEARVAAVEQNWREGFLVENMLTLALAVAELTSDKSSRERATKILLHIRTLTLHWIRMLRTAKHETTDASQIRFYASNALLASFLCRRTFCVTVACLFEDASAVRDYAESSIARQENLPEDIHQESTVLQNAMHRDAHNHQRLIRAFRESLDRYPHALQSAVSATWTLSSTAHLQRWEQLSTRDESWISATYADGHGVHRVDYGTTSGTLLVNGRPVGQLPQEYCSHPIVKKLLGDRSLQSGPSNMRDMSYQISYEVNGHEIHLGFRGTNLVIRSRWAQTQLEHIPPDVFTSNGTSWDLPGPLIKNHVHWLDLVKEVVYICPEAKPFVIGAYGWRLDLKSRLVEKLRSSKVRPLNARQIAVQRALDPHKSVYQQICQMFKFVELESELLAYLNAKGALCVRLNRAGLNFSVRKPDGMLQCEELRAFICKDQDIGTLYGLQSMLVLQDIWNDANRAVLIPLGRPYYARDGVHVAIKIHPEGEYAKFDVDEILGRLTTPVEPRLMYTKAILHALTSFVLPDPLTSRTGREEALCFLQSAACQPWEPLGRSARLLLQDIAILSPKRLYYPRDKKSMTQTVYSPHLTTYTQSDGFRPLARFILRKSDDLIRFYSGKTDQKPEEPFTEASTELASRHMKLQALGNRECETHLDFGAENERSARVYKSRDRPSLDLNPQTRPNVIFAFTRIIKEQQPPYEIVPDTCGLLESFAEIGGFQHELHSTSLHEVSQLEIGPTWGSICQFCARLRQEKKYFRLSVFFAVLIDGHPGNNREIQALLAYATLSDLDTTKPPPHDHFAGFHALEKPNLEDISSILKTAALPFEHEDDMDLRDPHRSRERKKLQQAQKKYTDQVELESNSLARFVLQQWPNENISFTHFPAERTFLIDLDRSTTSLQPHWTRYWQHAALTTYLGEVQEIMRSTKPSSRATRPLQVTNECCFEQCQRRADIPNLASIIATIELPNVQKLDSGDRTVELVKTISTGPTEPADTRTKETAELAKIVSTLSKSNILITQRYARALDASLNAYEDSISAQQLTPTSRPKMIGESQGMAKANITNIYGAIIEGLNMHPSFRWLQFGVFAKASPTALLSLLASKRNTKFGTGVREALIKYGVSITRYQQVLRILSAQKQCNDALADAEMANEGHLTWSPADYPDWLLLELENNLLIREDQIRVALETISPSSGTNGVLQMSMGKGKSSLIIPMVAAKLANGEALMRVIVPRPLLQQSATLLISRLGGMVDRSLVHVPFSRQTPSRVDDVESYARLHKDVSTAQGVCITLPENIMSFKLSGLQKLCDQRMDEAESMFQTQKWLDHYCRDVLDESDILLAPRVQLVYPSGHHETVDGHPNRWRTIESVLEIARDHLIALRDRCKGSVEVVQTRGYPSVFFLRKSAEDELISLCVRDVMRGHEALLPVDSLDRRSVDILEKYLTREKLSRNIVEEAEGTFSSNVVAQNTLILLRGLFVTRILLMCLNRRWNVQYGLHPDREPIAVPFYAKGQPHPQAEWGHPDVSLMFTCLSFYYQGLNIAQTRRALEFLHHVDNPAGEYERWIQFSTDFPEYLNDWNTVNLSDSSHLHLINQNMGHSRPFINFFLNGLVFPKYAKSFEKKLAASGWDMPQLEGTLGKPKSDLSGGNRASGRLAMTTGFSGTNDNRELLPLSIKQRDLPELLHTNAEVLSYLIQQRNRAYHVMATNERRFSESEFLDELKAQGIRVLIDAGAFILELSNQDVARLWLEKDTQAKAAVFFHNNGRAWVRYRAGQERSLLATPFAENMEECVVYLDEAHTRGTDLKLPRNAVGALTLALGQSKDHTVQACMRLRQLATTQSISLWAPPEVDFSIRDSRMSHRRSNAKCDSVDVVFWLLLQSSKVLNQWTPLYYAQGLDYCRREQALRRYQEAFADESRRTELLRIIEQSEKSTLSQLYSPLSQIRRVNKDQHDFNPPFDAYVNELVQISESFQDIEGALHPSALAEVEQQREEQKEVEQTRELHRPVHYEPAKHLPLSDAVVKFVNTGHLPLDGKTFRSTVQAMNATAPGRRFGVQSSAVDFNLCVTKDFEQTINFPKGTENDSIALRPVQWILWACESQQALIISPHEAEKVLPHLRRDGARACLVVYSAPTTRKTVHFNDFKFFTFPATPEIIHAPSWLRRDLGIFAGRLYFPYEDYADVVNHLGEKSAEEVEGSLSFEGGRSKSTVNAATFIREWLALRRKGQDFTQSPMGFVCQGKVLEKDHPFFVERTKPVAYRQIVGDVRERIDENEGDSKKEEDDDEDEVVSDAEGDISE